MTILKTLHIWCYSIWRSSGKTPLKPKFPKELGLYSSIQYYLFKHHYFTCEEKRFCMPQFLSGKEHFQHCMLAI